MMETVNTVLGPLCACMQSPAVQEKLSYILKSTSKLLIDVENESDDLKAKENHVQRAQEAADGNGKQLTDEVGLWLKKVEHQEKENKINQMKHDYDNRGCFLGSCSLNCWAKYKINRRSIKLIKEMKNLKTQYDAFKDITENQPPRAVREIPTSSNAVGTIINLNLKKVHGYLADDNVSIVGIWGMGGVGKTTLLNEINNSLQGGDTNIGFKYVIYLVVSQEPQFEKLQKEICKRLGLSFDPEKSVIFDFLKNKDFLLLLDDIWKRVDLPEALGIPLPHNQRQSREDKGQRCKQKVIFTTRKDDVCAQMKADKRIKVECLGREEAWHLFKQNADESLINSNTTVEKLAMKVMEKCSGLPLALKVVGRATLNKKRIEEWADMLETIPDIEESLFDTLKVSYDNLDGDTLRGCFLCCAQWPEDMTIKVSELIEYWIGFGLIDGFRNIGKAFDKGYSLIGKLNEASLLELKFGFDDDYVKLHDVIRDMALWIVSEYGKKKNKWIIDSSLDDLSQSSRWEASNWKETERIFISGQSTTVFQQLLSDQKFPRCPNLKSLFLYDLPDQNSLINCFLHTSPLIYLNLSWTRIFVLPKEIRVLVNLRYLNISYTNISSLPPELEELKELKYFICRTDAFCRTPILDGLSTISRLPKLQVLDLCGNTCLEVGDLSLLKRRVKAISMEVTSLETLRLLKDFPTWNINLLRLKAMPSLHFCDLSCKHGGEGLMELKIDDCDFEEFLLNGSGVSLKRLNLENLSKLKQITWREISPSECFQRLEVVTILQCDSLRNLSFVLYLPCLRTLWVHGCRAMEELIDPAEMQQASSGLCTFPSLQDLKVWGLPNLVSLSTCPLDFPVLFEVELGKCPKLKKLPFKSSIVNNKLERVTFEKELWEGLEWEDTTIQSHLAKLWVTPW